MADGEVGAGVTYSLLAILPLCARVHFSMLSAQDASLCISMWSMFTELSSVESAQCTQLGSFGSCWLTEDLAPVASRAAQHPRHSCCTKQLGKSADNIRAIFQLWSANFLAVATKIVDSEIFVRCIFCSFSNYVAPNRPPASTLRISLRPASSPTTPPWRFWTSPEKIRNNWKRVRKAKSKAIHCCN